MVPEFNFIDVYIFMIYDMYTYTHKCLYVYVNIHTHFQSSVELRYGLS